MIIGNGLLASAFKNIDNTDIIIFASGVSNSNEVNKSEFDRELNLLSDTLIKNPNKKLIYFSTCSVYDPSKKNSSYVTHKLNIESFIKNNSSNFIIFRVGNIVGNGGNPNTLFNFLSSKIKNNEKINLYINAKRILIDVDDVVNIVNNYKDVKENMLIDIGFPHQYSIQEIISAIEQKLNIKAMVEEVIDGNQYTVSFNNDIASYFKYISNSDYLKKLTEKYIK